ncbi:MAG TPA: sporulation-specific diadenylate cyclase CdaS [Chondromyces sp.]|nr:sporulation-specific diadenylate cyclase CdaS [Chondromyces sp.]
MDQPNCDFSPMKQTIKEEMQHVITSLQSSLQSMDDEEFCLLGNLEQIKNRFVHTEILAATFYLNCYLSPYTDKHAELSVCVQNMSNRRHGGLIVIQREDHLGSLLQPGILIGANLTHTLLESIFFPGNPLHDGAVLVNRNEIVSASNVLPLSHKFVGDKKVGTRHRAALGISERSDALALVVSEETGRISFALNGNLYPLTTERVL